MVSVYRVSRMLYCLHDGAVSRVRKHNRPISKHQTQTKEEQKMKRFIGLIILAVCFMFLLPQVSEARVRYLMPPPPPIVFVTPPDMIELPGGVYVNPDGNEEIFFSNGYYWRPYQGRWYRSYRYDGGWDYYGGVPGWYGGVRGWRHNYNNHTWGGRSWNHNRIPHNEFRQRARPNR